MQLSRAAALVLFCSFLVLQNKTKAVEGLSFNYSSLGQERAQVLMKPFGSAVIHERSIDLTAANASNASDFYNLAGRVFNLEPLQLWNKSASRAASFNCSFSFHLQQYAGSQYSAEGLAFLLVRPDAAALPGGSSGAWLGLFNPSHNGSSANQLLAIEFDTFTNEAFLDPNPNHMGIDLNTIISNPTAPDLGFALYNSTTFAWIDYSSPLSLLHVYATNIDSTKPFSPLLSFPIDLSQFLPEQVLIGFSAATGGSAQHHTLLSWSFHSTDHPLADNQAAAGSSHGANMHLIIAVPLAIVAVLMIIGAVAFVFKRWPTNIKLLQCACHAGAGHLLGYCSTGRNAMADDEDSLASGAPRSFNYRSLSVATNNFSDTQMLGRGGSGKVYKGALHDEKNGTTEEIAVKCVAQDARQGEKEFLAEISIISRIRHRNLVLLKGWCREKKQLMLVYEFMPNGSLDQHLYPKDENGRPTLHCKTRFHIMCGMGHALQYLHEECETVIVHRDLKPSNVMLDLNFNAKLGDFGLARQLGEGASTYTTMVAGTRGYMAPEYIMSQRATSKSDVYGFGAMLVEVACGRRPIDQSVPEEFEWKLVDWVWNLHASHKIHEAIDPRLLNSCDWGEEDVALMTRVLIAGLACSHPDPNSRPTISEALGALLGRIPMFAIPMCKPLGPFYHMPSFSTSDVSELSIPSNNFY